MRREDGTRRGSRASRPERFPTRARLPPALRSLYTPEHLADAAQPRSRAGSDPRILEYVKGERESETKERLGAGATRAETARRREERRVPRARCRWRERARERGRRYPWHRPRGNARATSVDARPRADGAGSSPRDDRARRFHWKNFRLGSHASNERRERSLSQRERARDTRRCRRTASPHPRARGTVIISACSKHRATLRFPTRVTLSYGSPLATRELFPPGVAWCAVLRPASHRWFARARACGGSATQLCVP